MKEKNIGIGSQVYFVVFTDAWALEQKEFHSIKFGKVTTINVKKDNSKTYDILYEVYAGDGSVELIENSCSEDRVFENEADAIKYIEDMNNV